MENSGSSTLEEFGQGEILDSVKPKDYISGSPGGYNQWSVDRIERIHMVKLELSAASPDFRLLHLTSVKMTPKIHFISFT